MASDTETKAFIQRKIDDLSRQIERLQLQQQVLVDLHYELEHGTPREGITTTLHLPRSDEPDPPDEATQRKLEADLWREAQAKVSPSMANQVHKRRSEPR